MSEHTLNILYLSLVTACCATGVGFAIPAPTQADMDKAAADVKSTDAAQQHAAIKQIRA